MSKEKTIITTMAYDNKPDRTFLIFVAYCIENRRPFSALVACVKGPSHQHLEAEKRRLMT